jgi:hypothetical protein
MRRFQDRTCTERPCATQGLRSFVGNSMDDPRMTSHSCLALSLMWSLSFKKLIQKMRDSQIGWQPFEKVVKHLTREVNDEL